MNEHPVTPSLEQVQEWADMLSSRSDQAVFTMAAQWGADKELEMCIDVLGGQLEWDLLSTCTGWKIFRDEVEQILRKARRPVSEDLKSVALERLDRLIALVPTEGALALAEPIRIALECIDDD